MNSTITNLGLINDASSAMRVIAPFLILCGVGSALLPLSLQIAASVAGGYALRDVIDLQGRAQGAWRLWRDWRGNGYRQTALPPPSGGGYTIGPGGATVQRGSSYDPRAEQVAAALIESRAGQLRREQG
ncbi:MAG: hypothetical protein ACR652_14715 [Methylocystis sp.]|uniref:hypothetical protein n=1 Tax=Methylocystis sp. TaxID=1911079 RepID=UPI003DA635FB